MEPTIEITRSDLYAAFLKWGTAWRAGETLTAEEHMALSNEEASANCAEHMWELLEEAR